MITLPTRRLFSLTKVANCWLFSSVIFVLLFLIAGSAYPQTSQYGFSGSDVSIPDAGDWVSSTITISGAPSDAVVTGIDVYFKIVHTFSGDLDIDLNADAQGNLGDYDLWQREGDSADNPTRTVTGITTFNDLSVNRTWYLYARDMEPLDSGYIDEWSITVYYSATVGPPTISSPGTSTDTGFTVPNLTPTFTWNAVPGADSYGLYMSRSPYGPSNLIYSNTSLTGTSFVLPSGVLENGEKYRWQMTTFDNGVESDPSSLLYFQVSGAPDIRISPPSLYFER